MCRIVSYSYPGINGSRQIIEDVLPCSRVKPGEKLCSDVERKDTIELPQNYPVSEKVSGDNITPPAASNPPIPSRTGSYKVEKQRKSKDRQNSSPHDKERTVNPQVTIEIGPRTSRKGNHPHTSTFSQPPSKRVSFSQAPNQEKLPKKMLMHFPDVITPPKYPPTIVYKASRQNMGAGNANNVDSVTNREPQRKPKTDDRRQRKEPSTIVANGSFENGQSKMVRFQTDRPEERTRSREATRSEMPQQNQSNPSSETQRVHEWQKWLEVDRYITKRLTDKEQTKQTKQVRFEDNDSSKKSRKSEGNTHNTLPQNQPSSNTGSNSTKDRPRRREENRYAIKRPDNSRSSQADHYGWQIGTEMSLLNGSAPVRTLTKKRSLGDGRFGKVEEVTDGGSNATMARKRFFVPHFKEKRATAQIQRIQGEIASLKRLSHPHIVDFIGCYQEEEGTKHLNIYLLMQPVGDSDLKTFLEAGSTSIAHNVRSNWIRQWFICLTSALAYMHSKHVHHDDIKPSNIICRNGHVYFTDFSSSRRMEADDETSTTSEAVASRLFAAPEAFRSDDGELLSHGSKTDVYSLGLVFIELLVVLKGESIESFRNHVFSDYTSFSRQYYRVSDRFHEFLFSDLELNTNYTAFLMYRQCFEHMLRKRREDRPSAANVFIKMKKRNRATIEFFGLKSRCSCRYGI